jgi:hypothetical protein
MKKPKSWRPGKTPKFKEHPSVIRYRDPNVRSSVGVGFLDGHKVARFRAHPDCCDICARLDGTLYRISTVLGWKYVLAHVNCRCAWETGYKVDGKFTYDKPTRKGDDVELLDEADDGVEFHHDPPLITRLHKANPEGLVKKKIPIRRGGRTIYQERWVKPSHQTAEERAKVAEVEDKDVKRGSKDAVDKKVQDRSGKVADAREAAKQEKPSTGKEAPKGAEAAKKDAASGKRNGSDNGPEIPPEVLTKLQEHAKAVEDMQPGDSKRVSGVPVRSFQNGFFGLMLGGKALTVMGARPVAVIIDYASRVVGSGGAMISGDVSGASIQTTEAMAATEKASHAVDKAAAKAKSKSSDTPRKTEEPKRAKMRKKAKKRKG